MDFSNRSVGLLTAQKGNKGEDTWQAVEPEADEKLSIFRSLLFGQRGIPRAAFNIFWIEPVLVPVDSAPLPRRNFLLVPGRE